MSFIKSMPESAVARYIDQAWFPLVNPSSLDPLMDEIGDARYVLLGEASHGTHEYYAWRMHITKRLITEKKFNIVAVEGDWPDCYLLNRYIKGYDNAGKHAREVLQAFNRWPTWMWANWETIALAEWMHQYNQKRSKQKKAGFYGLDVYSLWESMDAIQKYLLENDKDALQLVKKAMDCFEPYHIHEGLSYANRFYGMSQNCKKEVEELLVGLRKNAPFYAGDQEAGFSATQNALVAVNAERYYEVMMRGGGDSWNIRDTHMNETINNLMEFYGKDAKIIIWEHNTHIGDARATDMKNAGLLNVGQLVKQQHTGDGVVRVGFGSYTGSVIAAYHWGDVMYKMHVPPARPGSWEYFLHQAAPVDKLLLSRDIEEFTQPIGHRAIGVVYDPEYEYGNYVPSVIPQRYEAFIYIDETRALHPLHIQPDGSQMPETFPFGI